MFTKIETILPCHTPKLSSKFCLNPSTTFWDILLYIVFVPIYQWWRITLKILVSGSGFGCSLKSNQFFLVIHPTCPPSVIRIRAQLFEISCYLSFWADPSMVKNQLKDSSIQLFEISCTQTAKQTNKQTNRWVKT